MSGVVVVDVLVVAAIILLGLGLGVLYPWLRHRKERQGHNDRDAQCVWWWGDRSGSPDLRAERCLVCRPLTYTPGDPDPDLDNDGDCPSVVLGQMTGLPFFCTGPMGHADDHRAAGDQGVLVAVWPNERGSSW